MNKLIYYSSDKIFQLTKEIAKGGEGYIFNILNYPKLVAKIYFKNSNEKEQELKKRMMDQEEKILYMIKNKNKIDINIGIAWPIIALYDINKNFVGFIMERLSFNKTIDFIYSYPISELDYRKRIYVAINLCKVVKEIHDADFVIGDFNPNNIGINYNNGHVAFVDTDSYHIKNAENNVTYRCTVCSKEYTPYELLKKNNNYTYANMPLPTFTKMSDLFLLSIHIFRLLMNGVHPFSGINVGARNKVTTAKREIDILKGNYCYKSNKEPYAIFTPSIKYFPNYLIDLFNRSFVDGLTNPHIRPNENEWIEVLNRYLYSIKQCKNNSLHYYHSINNECPYCKADNNYSFVINNTNSKKKIAPKNKVTRTKKPIIIKKLKPFKKCIINFPEVKVKFNFKYHINRLISPFLKFISKYTKSIIGFALLISLILIISIFIYQAVNS